MRRHLLWILGLSAAHAALTLTLLFVAGGVVMQSIDGPHRPSHWAIAGLAVVQVLLGPVLLLRWVCRCAGAMSAHGLDNVAFFLNSLLWGLALYGIITAVRARRRKRQDA